MALVDINATTGTKSLYTKLQNAQGNYIYFGISNYGIVSQTKQCHLITGKEPYVIAADYANSVDTEYNFANSREVLKKHYRSGGIVTFNWHMKNWVTNGNCFDLTGDVTTNILPGGSKRTEYLSALDQFASDMLNFKDDNGNLIPVIMRLWHENDMGWAWWHIYGGTSTANYLLLWADFVTYMRDIKGVHNLIYCYAPQWNHVSNKAIPMYPGDDYVDIIGIDQYQNTTIDAMIYYGEAYDFSALHNKIFAITEGCREIGGNPMVDYWINGYINPILADSKASKAAYALVWDTQQSDGLYGWGCWKGRSDEGSFLEMSQNPKIKMLSYKKAIINNATLRNCVIR